MPSSIFFILKNSGQRLPDSVLQKTKMAYLENGSKKYISDVNGATDNYSNYGILTSRLIGFTSADNNIKTYYLEYPNSSTVDTFFVDYLPSSLSTNCQYVLQTVKFNGKLAAIDTSFKFQPVYVLNK